MVSLASSIEPPPAPAPALALDDVRPARGQPDEGPPRHLLYITHARQDEAWVQGVLVPALGLSDDQLWTQAEDDLTALKLEELERAVVACRYTLLVASSAARADEWTQLAGLLAQHLGTEEGKPRLIVVTRDFDPESERGRELLPLRQRCLACLDCSDPERSAAALETLAAQLALTKVEEAPAECPYPGLRMFGAGDPSRCFDRPDLFFGRDEEGRRVVDMLRAGGRALLVGPSGCGKSSLVRARVLPALGEGDGAMACAVIRPGRNADGALRAALESLDPSSDPSSDPSLDPSSGPSLAAATDAYLAAEDREAALPALVAAAAGRRRLLCVDQLEEVFSDEGDGPAHRAAFFARLGALARVPGVAILLGMRADFYGDLMRSPIWEDVKDHRVELAPLRGAALREAIVRPAERVGIHVEADLVESLVREADRDRAAEALPLLQVALEQLWAQREWRYMSLRSYACIADGNGCGLDAVLARHADASIAALPAPAQELARRVLIDLVHLGEGRPDTRRRRTASELRRTGDDADALEAVLAHLSARRLIAVGAEVDAVAAVRAVEIAAAGGGAEIVERHVDLAHDTLITGWPALSRWVGERRDALRTQRQLEARAAAGGTLTASELPKFVRWIEWIDTPAGRALGATAALRSLVRRSRAARRLRRGAFAVGLVATVTFAVVFGLQTKMLRDERTRTQRSISKASETAQMVVFDVDQVLRAVPGAAVVREKLQTRATELLDELRKLGNLAENEQRIALVGALLDGDLALERGQLEEARWHFQSMLAQARRRAADDPDDPDRQRDLAVSYARLGDVELADGKLDDARAMFEHALTSSKRLSADDVSDADWQRSLVAAFLKLGDIENGAGRIEIARAMFEHALQVSRALAARDKGNTDRQRSLWAVYLRLGDLHVEAGRVGDARVMFEQALVISKALVAKDPESADWLRDLQAVQTRLDRLRKPDRPRAAD